MSKRPWFPFYTADFLRKTDHLSAEECGCYVRLMRHYWDNNGLLLNNPAQLCRIMGIERRRFKAVWPQLDTFFKHHNSGLGDALLLPRLQEELEKTIAISETKAKSGRKGGLAKAKAEKKHKPTHSHSHIPKGIPTTRGARLPDDWKPTPELIQWATKERPDLDLTKTTEKFCDHFHSISGAKAVKLRWDLTFRNWVRNEKNGSSRKHSNGTGYKPVQTPADRNAEATRRIIEGDAQVLAGND